MAALSQYTESNILTQMCLTATWSKPTVLALALTTSAGSSSAMGTEVSNSNAYARQACNPANANWSISIVSGNYVATNVNTITFPTATGSWSTVTGVALVDSVTYGAGNQIAYCSISSQAVAANNQVSFAPGAITMQIS